MRRSAFMNMPSFSNDGGDEKFAAPANNFAAGSRVGPSPVTRRRNLAGKRCTPASTRCLNGPLRGLVLAESLEGAGLLSFSDFEAEEPSVSPNTSALAPPQRTLPVRTMRPLYVDRLPPCNGACPAGENVQAWLAEAQAGRYRQAWEILVRDNPLPAVHGRVCYHPCEDSCNRQDVDQAINIHAVERFLGDLALEQRWTIQPDVRLQLNASSSSAPGRAASPPRGTLRPSGIAWSSTMPGHWPAA